MGNSNTSIPWVLVINKLCIKHILASSPRQQQRKPWIHLFPRIHGIYTYRQSNALEELRDTANEREKEREWEWTQKPDFLALAPVSSLMTFSGLSSTDTQPSHCSCQGVACPRTFYNHSCFSYNTRVLPLRILTNLTPSSFCSRSWYGWPLELLGLWEAWAHSSYSSNQSAKVVSVQLTPRTSRGPFPL